MKTNPFRIAISDATIADLRSRIERTRFPAVSSEAAWGMGADLGFMKQLAARWLDGYDFRAQEAAHNLRAFAVSLRGMEVL